jgi:hypothetical protein
MQRFLSRPIASVLLASLCASWSVGQTLKPRPSTVKTQDHAASPSAKPDVETTPLTMALSVPAGVPLKVVLDSEVRVRKVGQPVQGRTVEPVYVFDKLLIPAGTLVKGKISAIDGVPGKTRMMQATDGNFSPQRQLHLEFDELVMADGKHVPLRTIVSPAPDGVLRFVSANEHEKKNKVEDAASKKLSATRQQARQQWNDLQKQIHEPGKMHRLKRIAVSQLPVHPQYIDAGTTFNAELQGPLDFGTEKVPLESLTQVGSPPPDGSVVYARLVTPLSSATAKKGDAVEALITKPLEASQHLILPEGSVIKGSVMEVRPARRLARNGRLRILFHQVALPNGLEQRVETSLEGVTVAKGEHLKLDQEGGAEVTTPRTRYLKTGFAVMLAASAASPDSDAGRGTPSVGEAGSSAANGASGFRFVGMILGLAARSRTLSAGLGSYGAMMSIYSHFLARGRDVVYPKDMPMVIGLGTRGTRTGAVNPKAAQE